MFKIDSVTKQAERTALLDRLLRSPAVAQQLEAEAAVAAANRIAAIDLRDRTRAELAVKRKGVDERLVAARTRCETARAALTKVESELARATQEAATLDHLGELAERALRVALYDLGTGVIDAAFRRLAWAHNQIRQHVGEVMVYRDQVPGAPNEWTTTVVEPHPERRTNLEWVNAALAELNAMREAKAGPAEIEARCNELCTRAEELAHGLPVPERHERELKLAPAKMM